jgi:hypothetical protein
MDQQAKEAYQKKFNNAYVPQMNRDQYARSNNHSDYNEIGVHQSYNNSPYLPG